MQQKMDFFFFCLSPLSWTEMLQKYLPKPNLHQKKAMVTILWSAVSLTHYSFLNPGKTITSEKYAQQIDEIHQKLQCLQPVLVNRMVPVLSMTVPDHTLHSQHFWAMKFYLICCVHLTSRQPTAT